MSDVQFVCEIGQKYTAARSFFNSKKVILLIDVTFLSSTLLVWNNSGMLEDNYSCLCKKIDATSQHFLHLIARWLIKITINQTNWICFVLLRCSFNERSVVT